MDSDAEKRLNQLFANEYCEEQFGPDWQRVKDELHELRRNDKRNRRDNALIQRMLSDSRAFTWQQERMIEKLNKRVADLEEELAFNDDYYAEDNDGQQN